MNLMESFLPNKTESGTSSHLLDCTISYIDNVDNDKDYYHHCYKMIVCLDKTFICEIDGERLTELQGLIINKSVPHSFSAGDANFVIVLIKSSSVYGQKLGDILNNRACANINAILNMPQFNPLLPPGYMERTNTELIVPVHNLLNYILRPKPVLKNPVYEQQIGKAIHFIEENIHNRLWLDDVANHINLSAHRTRHIFVQHMSMSFSQYVLWRKIKRTLSYTISEKTNLTEACHQFGFTDQSHFNHSCKNILGLKPREIINSNRILI